MHGLRMREAVIRSRTTALLPSGPHCSWQRAPYHKRSMQAQGETKAVHMAPVCRASSSRVESSTTSVGTATQHVDYFAVDKRPVILFDGVCNFCNANVNIVLDWDKQGAFRLAALQSTAGRQLLARCGRSPDDISSIVLVEENGCYIKSDAVLRIATKLGMPFPLLGAGFLVPKFVRDPAYDLVANNRYSILGQTNSCRLSDDRFADRFLEA